MKLEDQVASLELSKKLKELGFPQEGLFWWVNQPNGGLNTNGYKWQLEGEPKTRMPQYDYIVAPTVSELGEILPDRVIKKSGRGYDGLQIWKWSGWNIEYHETFEVPQIRYTFEKTEADARAKILIYLLENKLISLEGK